MHSHSVLCSSKYTLLRLDLVTDSYAIPTFKSTVLPQETAQGSFIALHQQGPSSAWGDRVGLQGRF